MSRTVHCRSCELDLPVKAFRQDRIGPGTKRDRCKKCNAQSSYKWNMTHPERVKEIYANRAPKAAAVRAEWRKNNRESITKKFAEWRDANRASVAIVGLALVDNLDRLALRGSRLPPWANVEVIRSIYKEATRLTQTTGIPHEVDHIIPLKGKNVCGLHVESNLQIIEARINQRKKNSFEGVSY